MADFNEDTLNQMADEAVHSASAPPLIARAPEQAPQPAPETAHPTMQSLTDLTDEELNSLQQGGYLQPQQAERIRASREAALEPAVLANQKLGTNPEVDQQAFSDLQNAQDVQQMRKDVPVSQAGQNEMAIDRTNSFMKGTPMEQPTLRPTPLMPNEADANMQARQAEEEQRRLAEEQALQQRHQQELMQAQVQNEANIQQAADRKIDDATTKQSGNDWSSTIAQGIAVAMGEYARHLTGGETNLAVQTIDRLVKEDADKKKLSLEDRTAAQQAAYQQAQIKLKEEELKTDSQLKRAQIQKIQAEIGKAQDANGAKQQILARLSSGEGFTAEQLQVLPDKDRARAVLLSDGSYKLAVSPQRAKEAAVVSNNAHDSRRMLNELMQSADYFGNNVFKKTLSRQEIAKAQTNIGQLRGTLRPVIIGPGNPSEYEQRLLASLVPDPSDYGTMGSVNKKIYQQLLAKVDAGERRQMRSAGINVPPSPNDINISKLRAAYPKMTEKDAEEALIKTGQWKSN